MQKLEDFSNLQQSRERFQQMNAEEKQDADRAKWREFLSAYKSRLNSDGDDVDGAIRTDLMGKANPRFVLKNWILHDAIKKAEKGEYGAVQELLRACENCYSKQTISFVGNGGDSGEGVEGGGGKSMITTKQIDAPASAAALYNT